MYNKIDNTHVVNTIATASFKILSPNTNMYNMGSTSKAENIANVATGSTAEIKDPKAKLSTASSSYATSACKDVCNTWHL